MARATFSLRSAAVAGVAVAAAVALAACGGEDRGSVTVEGTGTGTAGTSTTSGTTTHSGTGTTAAGAVPAGVVAEQQKLAEELEHEGGVREVGEWKIGYIVEGAEGWWVPTDNGSYRWRRPARGETHHVEIIPIERSTGRIVPDVRIDLEILDSSGDVVVRTRPRFYYAEFFHYADNVRIPRPGTYTLRVRITPPPFTRHGEESQQPALAKGAEVTFRGVRFEKS